MYAFVFAIVAFVIGYWVGKSEARANTKQLLDLYLGTTEKMEREFRRRIGKRK